MLPGRYVRFGCFVEGVEDFDAGAFRLAPGEAAAMDPQTRIALQQTQVHAHACTCAHMPLPLKDSIMPVCRCIGSCIGLGDRTVVELYKGERFGWIKGNPPHTVLPALTFRKAGEPLVATYSREA